MKYRSDFNIDIEVNSQEEIMEQIKQEIKNVKDENIRLKHKNDILNNRLEIETYKKEALFECIKNLIVADKLNNYSASLLLIK